MWRNTWMKQKINFTLTTQLKEANIQYHFLTFVTELCQCSVIYLILLDQLSVRYDYKTYFEGFKAGESRYEPPEIVYQLGT